MLADKVAVVMGATGAVGSAVARALHREGARLFLCARDGERLSKLSAELDAEHAAFDATSVRAVRGFVEGVAGEAGRLDIAFNAIGPRADEGGYGLAVDEITEEQFSTTMRSIVATHFAMASAVAPVMREQRSGSVVTLSASLTGQFVANMTGVTAACGAVEAMTRSLAAELGAYGVRVNCVRAGGMPETRTIQETAARLQVALGQAAPATKTTSATVLRESVVPSSVADVVAFLPSDRARAISGQVINACAGAVVSR